jgi:hypothetical protein
MASKYWSAIGQKYGIDRETWESMLIMQSGRCDICGDPLLSPQVDHCHTSGGVRALLCMQCNVSLHHLENVEWRRRAEHYLKRTASLAVGQENGEHAAALAAALPVVNPYAGS